MRPWVSFPALQKIKCWAEPPIHSLCQGWWGKNLNVYRLLSLGLTECFGLTFPYKELHIGSAQSWMQEVTVLLGSENSKGAHPTWEWQMEVGWTGQRAGTWCLLRSRNLSTPPEKGSLGLFTSCFCFAYWMESRASKARQVLYHRAIPPALAHNF